jgi:hypothetical protein
MKKTFVLIVVLLTIFLIGCSGSISEELQCSEDIDCVPNACCHADGTVNKESAPNCSSMFCTMDCAPDTIDCGQGDLKCLEGQCQVVWKE